MENARGAKMSWEEEEGEEVQERWKRRMVKKGCRDENMRIGSRKKRGERTEGNERMVKTRKRIGRRHRHRKGENYNKEKAEE